jgi:hypothetical protein
MPRKFKTANYEETLDQKVSLREVLPPNHLARFVVDIISQLDLSSISGREPHHRSWHSFFAELPEPPPEEASATVKMAYKLRTELGQAIYRLRKCTGEPVIGIIKEVLGFRQFSLRRLNAATTEGWLVYLAFNLKRLHPLWPA